MNKIILSLLLISIVFVGIGAVAASDVDNVVSDNVSVNVVSDNMDNVVLDNVSENVVSGKVVDFSSIYPSAEDAEKAPISDLGIIIPSPGGRMIPVVDPTCPTVDFSIIYPSAEDAENAPICNFYYTYHDEMNKILSELGIIVPSPSGRMIPGVGPTCPNVNVILDMKPLNPIGPKDSDLQ